MNFFGCIYHTEDVELLFVLFGLKLPEACMLEVTYPRLVWKMAALFGCSGICVYAPAEGHISPEKKNFFICFPSLLPSYPFLALALLLPILYLFLVFFFLFYSTYSIEEIFNFSSPHNTNSVCSVEPLHATPPHKKKPLLADHYLSLAYFQHGSLLTNKPSDNT